MGDDELRPGEFWLIERRETTWEEAFPDLDLASSRLVVEESNFTVPRINTSREGEVSSFGRTVRCSVSKCQSGGFNVQDFIGSLYRERKEEGSVIKGCGGQFGSPRSRRRPPPQPCDGVFEVTAALVYRQTRSDELKDR